MKYLCISQSTWIILNSINNLTIIQCLFLWFKKNFFFRNASFTFRDISERLRIFFIKNDMYWSYCRNKIWCHFDIWHSKSFWMISDIGRFCWSLSKTERSSGRYLRLNASLVDIWDWRLLWSISDTKGFAGRYLTLEGPVG